MRQRSPFTSLLTAFLMLPLLAVAAAPVWGAGGQPSTSSVPEAAETLSPEQEADQLYNEGLRLRNQAWKLEEKAEKADSEKNRDKLRGKSTRYFERAAEKFTRATEKNSRMFQAHSSLGYALRRTGEFAEALKAYNRALALNPDYTEAIEYRAEAYLGLGRLDEAKDAYMHLFKADRERADELLAAMRKWVAERQENPADAGGEAVEAFTAWVEERSELAAQTADLASGRALWSAGR